MYAIDPPWWKHHGKAVAETFRGACFSSVKRGSLVQAGRFLHFKNSGTAALSLAADMGADRIVMVGYDCQFTGGKSHSHGDHPPGLGNAKSLPEWPARFAECAKHLKQIRRIEVINASRHTALRCFQRMSMEEALGLSPQDETRESDASEHRGDVLQPAGDAGAPG